MPQQSGTGSAGRPRDYDKPAVNSASGDVARRTVAMAVIWGLRMCAVHAGVVLARLQWERAQPPTAQPQHVPAYRALLDSLLYPR